MKSVSLVLNIVLAIAVAVLYYLQFQKPTESVVEDVTQIEADSIFDKEVSVIAYVNNDSLLKHYESYQAALKKLQGKTRRLERDLKNRTKGFETEVANFQQTAQSMTIAQAQRTQEDLRNKEQNLIKYQNKLQQDLLIEENTLTNRVYNEISEFLNEYAENRQIDLVLTYTRGSGVWYGSEGLDITEQVIAGLNNNQQEEETTTTSNTDQADSIH